MIRPSTCRRGDRRWGCAVIRAALAVQISLKYDVSQLTLVHQARLKLMAKSFRGAVFHGVRDIRVEDRPFPTRETLLDTDAVMKITSAGISPSNASFVNVKDYAEVTFTV